MTTQNDYRPLPATAEAETVRAPELGVATGSAEPYDPLVSLDREVERFMRTNLFTPMEVTGFYIQARCVISELRQLRQENEYLRKVRDRQHEIIRRHERTINQYEEQAVDGRF